MGLNDPRTGCATLQATSGRFQHCLQVSKSAGRGWMGFHPRSSNDTENWQSLCLAQDVKSGLRWLQAMPFGGVRKWRSPSPKPSKNCHAREPIKIQDMEVSLRWIHLSTTHSWWYLEESWYPQWSAQNDQSQEKHTGWAPSVDQRSTMRTAEAWPWTSALEHSEHRLQLRSCG